MAFLKVRYEKVEVDLSTVYLNDEIHKFEDGVLYRLVDKETGEYDHAIKDSGSFMVIGCRNSKPSIVLVSEVMRESKLADVKIDSTEPKDKSNFTEDFVLKLAKTLK